jgi:peptidyl-prolyl cis-trans isomerase C
MIVKKTIGPLLIILTAFFLFCIIPAGCSSKEEKTVAEPKPVMASAPVSETQPVPPLATTQGNVPPATAAASSSVPVAAGDAKKGADPGVSVEVDGVKLTKQKLDADLKNKLAEVKAQIPAGSLEQAKAEIRKGLIDEFVMRSLLTKELEKKKVTASDKEIEEILNSMKSQLPAGVTLEDMLKKNKLDAAKIREDIAMNIRINKLVQEELGGKVKITEKESTEFYNNNINQFQQPETVHARHILITTAAGDTEKIKAEKKAKAEDLRKQLVGGTDFAALAAKSSDCPSKQNGGDLGTFSRGQMVKPFEDAAFSQEKNAIGPVVQTEFGFHIIQVLERTTAKVMKLDEDLRKKITAYLENQKQEEAFSKLIKRLKAGANIVVYAK